MYRLASLLIVSLWLPITFAETESVGADGVSLHEANCAACHASRFGGDASRIYLRDDHRINSKEALAKQVRFCKDTIGLTWFDDEVEAVTNYLDQTYYHFTPAP